MEVADEDAQVLAVLGRRSGRGVEGTGHGLDRAIDIAVQLALIRDAAEGSEVGPEIDHPLGARDRFVIPAKLGHGVDDDALRPRRSRRNCDRLLAQGPAHREVVPGECEDAEPDHGVGFSGSSERASRVRLRRGVVLGSPVSRTCWR